METGNRPASPFNTDAVGLASNNNNYIVEVTAAGCTVDAWETTYVHQLPAAGDDHPVLRWVEGTALRGVRSIVDDDDWAFLRGELNARFAQVYPVDQGRVWFPFRRIFVVARR